MTGRRRSALIVFFRTCLVFAIPALVSGFSGFATLMWLFAPLAIAGLHMRKTAGIDEAHRMRRTASVRTDRTLEDCRRIVQDALWLSPDSNEAVDAVRAKTHVSWLTWGERIEITETARGELRIASRPRLACTVCDYGRNEENVRKLAKLLA